MRLQKADAVISRYAGLYAESAVLGAKPPPPSTGALRPSLHMHRPLTGMFGRRLLRLWGELLGTVRHERCARTGSASRNEPQSVGVGASDLQARPQILASTWQRRSKIDPFAPVEN